MLFQTFDDKQNCIAICVNQKIIKDEIPDGLSKTWSYSSYLKNKDIEYAQLYIGGKTLHDVCPEHLKENWNFINQKLKAFHNSFNEAKISLRENCFFDLVPERFLIEYAFLKDEITKYVFENYKRPDNYDFLKRFNELLVDIKYRELNIDTESFEKQTLTERDLSYFYKIRNSPKYIDYDLFGSITGRLSTKSKSFAIQNFQKAYRNVLKPQNDWFVAIDINAAELRTSLALLNKTQPETDMYEWIGKDILGISDRAVTKRIIIEWLYNSSNQIYSQYAKKLDEVFQKNSLKNMYWLDGYVNTPFGRKIESDEHHAIPYLNQSTFIDLYHRQIIKVDDYLKNKKSFISFLLHDEFVLDLSNEEKNDIIDILNIIQNTQYGKFLASVKIGKNYGDMKKLKIKV